MKQIKEVKKNSSNRRFYQKNFNPWDFNIADCVVRAISAALMMKYEFVAGIAAKADEEQIEYMTKTCMHVSPLDTAGVISEFQKEDRYFEPTQKTDGSTTVNEWLANMEQSGMRGVYLLRVGEKHPFHAICAYVRPTGSYFVDTKDSGDLIVFDYTKVLKQIPKSDPRRIDLRTFMKPGSWKKRFRDVIFEMAKEYQTTKDMHRKSELADYMEFLIDGEIFNLDEPDTIDMNDKLGSDAVDHVMKTLGR